MSGDLNKVMLIGRLGADPDTRYMPSGKSVSNIRIATSEKWRDKETGDQRERTEWHSIVAYDKLGEIVAEYARKGTQVFVEGALRTRKWQDKEGKDRYTTEVIAQNVQLLSRPQQQSASQPTQRQQQRPAPAQAHADDGFDDDIPF